MIYRALTTQLYYLLVQIKISQVKSTVQYVVQNFVVHWTFLKWENFKTFKK